MVRRLFFSIVWGSLFSTVPLFAQPAYNQQDMQVEKLDRALVAVHTSKGNFLSWRFFLRRPPTGIGNV